VSDITRLLAKSAATEHTIRVDPDDENLVMKVWVKELAFMKMQEAVTSFMNISAGGDVTLDLAEYWKFIFRNCIERCEPTLSTTQLLALNAYVAGQLTAVLPQPQDLVAGPL
jgi:hypothetical protein